MVSLSRSSGPSGSNAVKTFVKTLSDETTHLHLDTIEKTVCCFFYRPEVFLVSKLVPSFQTFERFPGRFFSMHIARRITLQTVTSAFGHIHNRLPDLSLETRNYSYTQKLYISIFPMKS